MDEQIPLGRQVPHSRTYDPDHLFAVERSLARDETGIPKDLPFRGRDVWHAHEISWLDMKGKPRVAVGRFIFPWDSPCIVESKSLKLYLNSFNQTAFESTAQVADVMHRDLSGCAGGAVEVRLFLPPDFGAASIRLPAGTCIDGLDVSIRTYRVDPGLLSSGGHRVEETLYSDLLRTNCPVTGQPDWASLTIGYKGPQIDREGLLAYIVSFREHTGFHENCVERIFTDITARCRPETLWVHAGFTRRGGIDINPFRTSCREENGMAGPYRSLERFARQ